MKCELSQWDIIFSQKTGKKIEKKIQCELFVLKIETLMYRDYVLLFDRLLEWLDRRLIGRLIDDW